MSIEGAVAALKRGELVGVPTDTLYGIAVDPYNEDALERIFELKGRPGIKPLALLVASIEQGTTVAAFSDRAMELAEKHWPGALTLVLPRLDSVPPWIGHRGRRTVGLRCPDHPIVLQLLLTTGPLAVTSANITGQDAVASSEDAEALFGDDVGYYLEGDAHGGMASTIIDLTQPAEWVLRQGPVEPAPSRRRSDI